MAVLAPEKKWRARRDLNPRSTAGKRGQFELFAFAFIIGFLIAGIMAVTLYLHYNPPVKVVYTGQVENIVYDSSVSGYFVDVRFENNESMRLHYSNVLDKQWGVQYLDSGDMIEFTPSFYGSDYPSLDSYKLLERRLK